MIEGLTQSIIISKKSKEFNLLCMATTQKLTYVIK